MAARTFYSSFKKIVNGTAIKKNAASTMNDKYTNTRLIPGDVDESVRGEEDSDPANTGGGDPGSDRGDILGIE